MTKVTTPHKAKSLNSARLIDLNLSFSGIKKADENFDGTFAPIILRSILPR
jgi:hypothetical protein